MREYIQLTGEHVLALRSVTGRGTGRPVNFRLGGETSRSSETDTFNVRQYNLRGYDDNLPQLSGRRMQLLTSEWRFPLARIERGWMSPPAGISQLSGRVFYEAGAAWNEGGSADRYYKSAGTELTADINLFYSLGLKVRLGYAHGFDDVLGDDVLYFSAVSSF
jgi:outer membrane protein assembly factor BamA